jgi:hypothetical protein
MNSECDAGQINARPYSIGTPTRLRARASAANIAFDDHQREEVCRHASKIDMDAHTVTTRQRSPGRLDPHNHDRTDSRRRRRGDYRDQPWRGACLLRESTGSAQSSRSGHLPDPSNAPHHPTANRHHGIRSCRSALPRLVPHPCRDRWNRHERKDPTLTCNTDGGKELSPVAVGRRPTSRDTESVVGPGSYSRAYRVVTHTHYG